MDSLEKAKAACRLDRRLKTLTHPALLVVDEIDYLPATRSGAVLFLQLNQPALRTRLNCPDLDQGFRGAITQIPMPLIRVLISWCPARPGRWNGRYSHFEVPTTPSIFGGSDPFTKTRGLHFGGR